MTGSRASHWSGGADRLDFFDAKGTAELLARAFRARWRRSVAEWPWFVPGRYGAPRAGRRIARSG